MTMPDEIVLSGAAFQEYFMDANMAMFITLGVFITSLAMGFYIHSVLLGVGVLGICLLGDVSVLPGLLGYQPYTQIATYSLTTIPLFVIMAQFMIQSGIVDDMFRMVYNLSKGRRGALGALTLFIGAFLGAVSGSGVATAASLGQIAVPQLTKHGYNENLAGAVASAAGSLSGIIPPSIIIILFGVITETPIGDLFIAAFIPGILITLVFTLTTLVFLALEKKPLEERKTFEPLPLDRRQVRIGLIVGSLIVLTIFGGIYSGLMTPTEAGAAGSMTAFVGAFLLGKINKAFIMKSLAETCKVTGMVLLIVVAAKVFGRCISLSMITRKFIAMLQPLIAHPEIMLVIICLLFFTLFMFLEGTAVIVMTLPLLLPIIKAMNLDILWFGIFVSLLCTIGLLTPPVGLSVYAVCGITKLKVNKVFFYTTWMAIAASVLVGGLMIVYPRLATLLL